MINVSAVLSQSAFVQPTQEAYHLLEGEIPKINVLYGLQMLWITSEDPDTTREINEMVYNRLLRSRSRNLPPES